MENGEIKGFINKVSLDKYLENSNILSDSKTILLGSISLEQFKKPLKALNNDLIIGIFKDGNSVIKAVTVNIYNINV